ncbi:MAG: glycosyltransferase family 4 protein [Promethearchaeota archaeon]
MCSHQFSVGGISKVAHELRDAFIRLGHSVDVLVPLRSLYRKGTISIPCLNVPGLIGSLSFWECAIRMVKKKRNSYDLIMMHHPVLLDGKFPYLDSNVILTFHGTYYGYSQAYNLYKLGHLGPYYDIASQIESRLLTTLSKVENGNITITGVSPSTISELQSNGYSGVAHFIPNALPRIDRIVSKERARSLLKHYAGLHFSPKDRVLLYVGSIKNVASKRPLLVLSLFRKMASIDNKMKLVIIGGGYSSHQLKSLIRHNKNIFYFESVAADQLYLFYLGADAYISLSCYEGLPNSVLEAAAYGLPLILSNIPAHKWILSSQIGHGILINSFNPTDDIDIVYSFFASLHDSRHFPNSDILRRCGWNQIAKEYLMKSTHNALMA